jgi:catechol 2,3-dioxygenase-like lactoylglutathione lyase family enzyme
VTGPDPSAVLGPPVQIAYAVPDAEAAARWWSDRLGVGPFLLRRHIEVTDVVYRGSPATFDHTSAYGQWGPLMVELVQDHGPGPDAIRERFGPDQSGLHHLAFVVDDLDASLAALAALGWESAMSATTRGGVRFHFVDAVATHGHMLELYERSDRLAAFYAEVAAAADGWDGSDPVRVV